MPRLQIAAVIGMSYCGSTLLNFMMDSHPSIYGGGELHWLLERKKRDVGFEVQCTACGMGCPYWTPEVLDRISVENFYSYISGIFGVHTICDTSKGLSWFERMHPHHREHADFIYVVLVKHPIRHLASFVANWENKYRGWRKQRRFNKYLINAMIDYYGKLFQTIKQSCGENVCQVIRYEDLVTEPDFTLRRLLKVLDLDYDPMMRNCYNVRHHQIGGNAGALYQAVEKWMGGEDAVHPVRKNQYESQKGVFLDNKFKDILSKDEMKWLLSHRKIKSLCESLGYKHLD